MSGLATWIFTLCLGYYSICALQWYSYKIERVLFNYAKPKWHLYYALLPFLVFNLALMLSNALGLLLGFIYIGLLVRWQMQIKSRLVITERVTRYFLILAVVAALCLMGFKKWYFLAPASIVAVVLSFYLSLLIERELYKKYEKQAIEKLKTMKDLKIVLITASYGKTSIKNYLQSMLESVYKVQASPRSVNTAAGLLQDINENLNEKTQIYIAEAGARAKGDILEIVKILNPQFVIIGQIGNAHLEYFKNLENTRATKLEALKSTRLKKIIAHSSTGLSNNENTIIYDELFTLISSGLDGLKFTLKIANESLELNAPNILGSFNASNLTAAALMANELGLSSQIISQSISTLKNPQHRLSRINAGGKIIIDDGFNGNFEGMSASYELVRGFNGRKVLVTPGIIEGAKDDNIKLAALINEIFDLVIITGDLNQNELKSQLNKPEIITLKNKSDLEQTLAQNTKSGDLILFSNDAPEYI